MQTILLRGYLFVELTEKQSLGYVFSAQCFCASGYSIMKALGMMGDFGSFAVSL